jgi:hypothetical protein
MTQKLIPGIGYADLASGAGQKLIPGLGYAEFSSGGSSGSLAFALTLGGVVFSGGFSAGAASITLNALLGRTTFSGGLVGDSSAGIITTTPLENNTGYVLANEVGILVDVYSSTTGELLVRKTGQSTNSSGILSLVDAVILAGVSYRVVVTLASGAMGMDVLVAV